MVSRAEHDPVAARGKLPADLEADAAVSASHQDSGSRRTCHACLANLSVRDEPGNAVTARSDNSLTV